MPRPTSSAVPYVEDVSLVFCRPGGLPKELRRELSYYHCVELMADFARRARSTEQERPEGPDLQGVSELGQAVSEERDASLEFIHDRFAIAVERALEGRIFNLYSGRVRVAEAAMQVYRDLTLPLRRDLEDATKRIALLEGQLAQARRFMGTDRPSVHVLCSADFCEEHTPRFNPGAGWTKSPRGLHCPQHPVDDPMPQSLRFQEGSHA